MQLFFPQKTVACSLRVCVGYSRALQLPSQSSVTHGRVISSPGIVPVSCIKSFKGTDFDYVTLQGVFL